MTDHQILAQRTGGLHFMLSPDHGELSNESFMQNLKDTINDLKIRAGWGQTGNQNIGGYRWGASITKMPSNLGMGFRQSNIANPYITWEKQEQINLGLDVGFLKTE